MPALKSKFRFIVKVTIHLNEDLLDHFGDMANASGGKTGYQTLITAALHEYVEGKAPKIEDTLAAKPQQAA